MIFAAIVDLFEKNEPIDIVMVAQFLKDQGKLDIVGGRQYLTDLALSVATTANVIYAKSVNKKLFLRISSKPVLKLFLPVMRKWTEM